MSDVDVSCELARLPIVRWLAPLARVARQTNCRYERAQLEAEQALRLGAQELRPAGADPPRRRPEARAT